MYSMHKEHLHNCQRLHHLMADQTYLSLIPQVFGWQSNNKQTMEALSEVSASRGKIRGMQISPWPSFLSTFLFSFQGMGNGCFCVACRLSEWIHAVRGYLLCCELLTKHESWRSCDTLPWCCYSGGTDRTLINHSDLSWELALEERERWHFIILKVASDWWPQETESPIVLTFTLPGLWSN